MQGNLISTRISAMAVVLACGVTLSAAAQRGGPRTAEQQFKNIQVLKGTPANELVPAMHLIERDLGVDCEFCHVEDRAADDKAPKATARKMMQMVMDINKNNFGGAAQVTCFTCHRGNADPATVPTLPQGEAMMIGAESLEPKEPTLPSADQVVAKYVQALGGEAALRKVTTRSITATWQMPTGPGGNTPVPAQVERYDKAPNLTVSISHTAMGTNAMGFDGSTAWLQDAKGGVADAPAIDLGHLKRDADFYAPLDLKQTYTRLSVTGVEKVNGRDAYVVVGLLQGEKPDQLFFDTQSGLLVRKVVTVPTSLGDAPMAFEYDDYRNAGGGVKFPYTIRSIPGAPYSNYALFSHSTLKVTKVQDNAPLDDAKFARPKPAPGAGGGRGGQ